ncbi:uncharacterized protein QC761_0010350 [Podospora bellae-mahoneyi]|uniref:Uncharacterized protein n=1 Tax=Podospora bellae-mahoneyi TaxID=2093777 RepID=A0ABR0FXQ5_9PEZI|nr:hypothetical protein QC761_0010350 [Podospora bellae-mahoneyi]
MWPETPSEACRPIAGSPLDPSFHPICCDNSGTVILPLLHFRVYPAAAQDPFDQHDTPRPLVPGAATTESWSNCIISPYLL